MKTSVADIARWIKGEVVGDGNALVTGCAGIKEAQKHDITFLADPKYGPLAEETLAAAIIVDRQASLPVPARPAGGRQAGLPGKTFIRVDDPSLAFNEVMRRLLPDPSRFFPKGIHPTALIAKDALLGTGVAIGPYTVVEGKASIGEGTIVHGHCFIGRGTSVGARCLLYSGVVLREEITVGNRVIIQSGAVIGSDGYGYATVAGRHVKLPQIGTVVIGDDVAIGANVTVDRARFDKTVIGEGTKIDNLVHIAHNVTIGKHCLIVAQSGVSGSTRIGNYVILAGQSGIVGHLTIGDGAIVTAQSGVSKDIGAGETVFGSPAQPIKNAFRANAHIQRLDQYVAMIKDLKERVAELEKNYHSKKDPSA